MSQSDDSTNNIYLSIPEYLNEQAWSPIPPPRINMNDLTSGYGGGGGGDSRGRGRGGRGDHDMYRGHGGGGGRGGPIRHHSYQHHQDNAPRNSHYSRDRDQQQIQPNIQHQAYHERQPPPQHLPNAARPQFRPAQPQPQSAFRPLPPHTQTPQWLQNPVPASTIDASLLKLTVAFAVLPDLDKYCYASAIIKLATIKSKLTQGFEPEPSPTTNTHAPSPQTPQNSDSTQSSKRAFERARKLANPYEEVGRTCFVNRSAVKMANLDALVGLFSPQNKNFRFLDVCAGPGGFTEYLFWRSWTMDIPAKGWGMTLRGELDFHFDMFHPAAKEAMLGAFKAYYGVDRTGDICKNDNVQGLVDLVVSSTDGVGVDLVVGDGGFSCAGDELHQEDQFKHILLGQVLSMCMTLKKGGDFVVKCFEMCMPFTVGVFYLLYRSFEKVSVIKPFSSRPANSERYILCKNLLFDRSALEPIVSHLKSASLQLARLRMPASQMRGDASALSSHTEPPAGFIPLEERVNLGLLDVIQVVDMEQVAQIDSGFVDRVKSWNVTIAAKQGQALQLVEKFMNDPDGELKHDQAEIRRRCLAEWGLPEL